MVWKELEDLNISQTDSNIVKPLGDKTFYEMLYDMCVCVCVLFLESCFSFSGFKIFLKFWAYNMSLNLGINYSKREKTFSKNEWPFINYFIVRGGANSLF